MEKMEVERGHRGSLAALILVFLVLFGVPALQGEHIFFTPPLAWLALLILIALWWSLGRPWFQTTRIEKQFFLYLLLYLVFHTLFLGTDRYAWTTVATHGMGLALGTALLAGCLSHFYRRDVVTLVKAWIGLVAFFHVGLVGLRLTGFMPYRQPIDWSFFTTLVLVLGLGSLRTATGRWRFGGVAAIAVSVLALFLHQNRTALLCTLLFLVYETLRGPLQRVPRRMLWFAGGLILVTGSLLMWLWTVRDPYGTLRLQMWNRELRFLVRHPLGTGLGQLPLWMPMLSPAQTHLPVRYGRVLTHPHQQYLGWIMELGWPMLAFLGFFVVHLVRVIRYQLPQPAQSTLGRVWVMVGLWGFFHDLTASAVLLFFVATLGAWTLAVRRIGDSTLTHLGLRDAVVVTLLVLSAVPMMLSQALVGRGQAYAYRQQPQRARPYFLRALHLWRSNAWAHYRLARAQVAEISTANTRSGLLRWYPVLNELFQAVMDHPGEARFLRAHARAWTRFHENYPGAASLRMADEAWSWYLNRRPFDVLGRLQCARLLAPTQAQRAVELARTALRQEPNFLDGLYFLYQLQCRQQPVRPVCTRFARRMAGVMHRFPFPQRGISDYGRAILAVPPARTPVHERP